MSLNLKNRFTQKAVNGFKQRAVAGGLALSMAFTPMALAEDSAANDSATAHATNVSSTTSMPYVSREAAIDAANRGQEALRASKGLEKVGVFLNRAPDTKYSAERILWLTGKMLGDDIKTHNTVNYAIAGRTTLEFFVNGTPVIFDVDGSKTSQATLGDLKERVLDVADIQRALVMEQGGKLVSLVSYGHGPASPD